ncbi:hypothetical protein GLOTRDRAFT_125680 [Gloeophyllum trabeum ATCC 11539]|uniref:Uncharacterized protein n=1 Tax=Gloeophyllum trabeum (strain ATCC 11539 / FP-39264 / Madison 617) TaxID=670483 RepID=S7QJ28_GLOTA|nr:uncharacterized protein GLOTRDRAFT_125680 [Gloeophyllum trabeum ATCC 11539]EPQ59377.1 hypothetical protein GLOTRDRAFT_125680 [Gloeophyllum trabeum ATCC 11539]
MTQARPSSAWTSVVPRLAVVSAVILPIAFVPYLLVRRQLHALHRSAENINSTFQAVQRDSASIAIETTRLRQAEQLQTRTLLRQIQWDVDHLRQDLAALQRSQSASEDDLRRLREEADAEKQRARSQLTTLNELGLSLADIAAFLQEIEVKGGFTSKDRDPQWIERLRGIAMELNQKLRGSK